jgi:hypothetical protein
MARFKVQWCTVEIVHTCVTIVPRPPDNAIALEKIKATWPEPGWQHFAANITRRSKTTEETRILAAQIKQQIAEMEPPPSIETPIVK